MSTAGSSYKNEYVLSLSSDGSLMSADSSGFKSGRRRGFIYNLLSFGKFDCVLHFNSNET